MPKVSVILSSYNQGKYLADSIKSVLAQTFSDFELLIFDDGSSDNSQDIIRSFDDARIRLFMYAENRGPYHAIQEPLKVACGEYLALHHSDDVWEPTKLAEQVKFLDANPQYAACFTQVRFIDESGELYDLPESHPYKYIFRQANRSREEWLNYLFWRSNCFCNPSVLIRNAAENFSLNPYLAQLPDYFMWLNLCKRRNVYVIDRELIRFRLRRRAQESVSSLSLDKMVRAANETYIVVREFLPLLDDEEEFLAVFPEARAYLRDGRIETAFAFAQLCLKHNLPAYHRVALEILYELLMSPEKSAVVKKIYGYDDKKFMQDTGKFDVFGVRHQAPVFNGKLYIDFGAGFNESDTLTNLILIRPDGRFTVKFGCPTRGEISALRFDPDDKIVPPVKLDRILVNGETVGDYSSNAFHVTAGFHIFMNMDPWFEIPQKISASELTVEITGVVDKNPQEILNTAIDERSGEVVMTQAAELQAQREEIRLLREQHERIQNSIFAKIWRRWQGFKDFIRKLLG